MSWLDPLLIGFIVLLLWGAKKLPDLARQVGESIVHGRSQNRISEVPFFTFTLILLMIGILMWAIILAE